MDEIPRPIPARLIDPWILDNQLFISEDLPKRNRILDGLRSKRSELVDGQSIIKFKNQDNRVPLAAVDAAKAEVLIGDLVSILVQAVLIEDDGRSILGQFSRATGIHGHEMSMIGNPIRIASECEFLSKAKSITIADASFWSLLFDVNLGITLKTHTNNAFLRIAIDRLVIDELFLNTIRNKNIIAMSKQGEAHTLDPQVSDREAYGRILDAGEYTRPHSIMAGLEIGRTNVRGGFMDQRGFSDSDFDEIDNIYRKQLGVIYFKPHTWSRAFRIEAYLDTLNNASKLLPILSAIHHHTKIRTIVEPWPQFMADFTSKQLSCIASLYGEMNRHRTEITQTRTKEYRK